jgi:hypothetical protein
MTTVDLRSLPSKVLSVSCLEKTDYLLDELPPEAIFQIICELRHCRVPGYRISWISDISLLLREVSKYSRQGWWAF